MAGTLRCDLVIEQALGHITHTRNLQRLLPEVPDIEPRFLLVPFDVSDRASHIPGWSNWTVRAGLRGRQLLRRAWRRDGRPDVMFVHTQVPAILLGGYLSKVPTIVSLDATPVQYDELGEFYAHARGPGWLEDLKYRANVRCFERAAHLVTWSQWAKDGLVADYRVRADDVTVISPGVDTALWKRAEPRTTGPDGHPVQLLFVGGDLRRKGGDVLIDAFRHLRDDPATPPVELHLVTPQEVAPERGVVVHRGLAANSPELIAQYHEADVFCLPTRGDCLPMVLAEAAAASLPLVSTSVGAIHEIVRPGETGQLVPPGDVDALVAALGPLISDTAHRRNLGERARRLAEDEHDAGANAARLAGLLRLVARQRSGTSST
jgi:glycosyltransferase involved in cell wall biosynthesis